MTEKELDKIAKERAKHCPFCPVKPKIEEHNLFKIEYVMHCPQCGITLKSHSLEDLLDKWNTRYQPEGILISRVDLQTVLATLSGILNPIKDEITITGGILDALSKQLKGKYLLENNEEINEKE